MKRTPAILGAISLALISGAVAGKSIVTEPISTNAGLDAVLPQQHIHPQSAELATVERLPDHYPMTTPEGVIEVSELALRGRYSQRSYSAADGSFAAEPYSYEAPEGRYAYGNTSLEAAMLDAAQPDPRSGRTLAHVEPETDPADPAPPAPITSAAPVTIEPAVTDEAVEEMQSELLAEPRARYISIAEEN